jgi:hypothetical protein
MVRDDMREDFFEALEKTPTRQTTEKKQAVFSELDGIHFESPTSSQYHHEPQL